MRNFILGLGAGAVVGLLIAPDEGRKTQEKIRGWLEQWQQSGGEEAQGKQNQTEERWGKQAQRQTGEPSQTSAGHEDVWERVEQERNGPEHEAAEEVDRESKAVAEVLNTAKRDELLSVPGIGRATAKRIIKNRPYESEEEILEEGVMPEKTLERVKEELIEKKHDIAS